MVGTLIRARREARGLSQAELAARTGLAPAYISRIERGDVVRPRRATLQKLGSALGFRVSQLHDEAGAADPMAAGEPGTFGAWLRRMIAARGFASERQFAAQIGVAPKYLSRLLNGDVARPTYKTIWRIADALRVPIAEVVEWARRPPEDGAVTDRSADAATGTLAALLDHLQDDREVMAQLDALGALGRAELRDIADLLAVHLRGVLRARAAHVRPRAELSEAGESASATS